MLEATTTADGSVGKWAAASEVGAEAMQEATTTADGSVGEAEGEEPVGSEH